MASGQILSTEIDVSAVQEALAGTNKSLKAIQKDTLRIVARATAKEIRAAIRSSGLHQRTGELLKAYTYKVRRDGESATVFPKGISGKTNIFPKVMTLSYGHEGPTKRASSWYIAPRGFVQRGENYAANGNYMDEVQKMIDKEIEKYWG